MEVGYSPITGVTIRLNVSQEEILVALELLKGIAEIYPDKCEEIGEVIKVIKRNQIYEWRDN